MAILWTSKDITGPAIKYASWRYFNICNPLITMRKLFRLAGILTVTGALAACSGEKTTANYHTIPIPQEIKISSEGEFVLNSGTKIIYPDGNTALSFKLK